METPNTALQPITHQLTSSTIILTDEGLTISISRRVWTPRHWDRLVNLMLQLVMTGLLWITLPSRVLPIQGQPRWKQITLDGLTCLLFAVMIRSNHPLRKLFDAIDWQSIDVRCTPAYKNQERGAPAYAPQVLFRILVLMFVSGTPFESATLLRLETDLAWRWFAGLSVLCGIPDAGTLSRFRSRVGVERFEAIMVDLIRACDTAGLLGHDESDYDMTGVAASATQATPYQRAVILSKALSTWLDAKHGGVGTIDREQIARIALEVLRATHPSLKTVQPSQIVCSQGTPGNCVQESRRNVSGWWQRILRKISRMKPPAPEAAEVNREQVSQVAQELVPELPQAFGDPDATVGHTRTDGTLCGYRSGFLVDATRFIITAVIFVTLSKTEAPTVTAALDTHYAIFGAYPKRLGLDSAFDRDNVHRYTEEHNIFSGITVRSRPGPAGVFHADACIWNEEGQLICPNGEEMEHIAGPYKNGNDRYRARAECAQCPFFEQCLTAAQREKKLPRRELQTNTAAHQRAQRNRERSRSPEGKAIRRQRFSSEGVFGHVNRFHNGDKAPYRNDRMNHIAQLMVACVYNLEKLATYG